MFALRRLPLRLAACVAPPQTRLAGLRASSVASYRAKSDAAAKPVKAVAAPKPKKAAATSKPKKAAAKPKPKKAGAAAKSSKSKAAAKLKELDPGARKAARAAAKASAAKKAYKLLSPEEQAAISAKAKQIKLKENVKLLKAQALSPPLSRKLNVWAVYVKLNTKANGERATAIVKTLAQSFKAMSTREREDFNQLVDQTNTKILKEYQEWLNKHSPADIQQANAARAQLRQKLADSKHKYLAIKDDRQVKRPSSSYLIYHQQRFASGDFRNMSIAEAARAIADEYNKFSAAEKKKYEDAAVKDVQRYAREHLEVYGVEMASAAVTKDKAAKVTEKAT